MLQLYVPLLGVESSISLLYVPDLYRSIFTLLDILSLQVILYDVPICQVSPPLGDVTFMESNTPLSLAIIVSQFKRFVLKSAKEKLNISTSKPKLPSTPPSNSQSQLVGIVTLPSNFKYGSTSISGPNTPAIFNVI